MSSSSSSDSKIVLVIGATGAQGLPVVRALLAPSSDGKASPWKVRALTRDPTHRRAKELESLGVELYQGSFMDFDLIARAMKGVYAAFVNTDGLTVGVMAEVFAGIKIYEAAKIAGVRHYVYSSLAYTQKAGGWKDIYLCDHLEGKARVADYLKSQPNEIDDPNGTMWSILTTGPYMDMMHEFLRPLKVREDGTVVFASPLGDGSIPFIALQDLAFWARYILDTPKSTTGIEFEVASEVCSYEQIVDTFSRVTGKKSEYKRLTLDEYFDLFASPDSPVASDVPDGTTFRKTFSGFWATWRDNVVKRDMNKVLAVHPNTLTLEKWMTDNNFTGEFRYLLKDFEDSKLPLAPNMAKIAEL